MPDDLTEREERVRAEAHRLWREAGEPEGRDEEFWHAAEILLREREGPAQPDGRRVPRG